ncbi:hypothetical protein [Metapseudomonas otitidis]|uniref:hypothetical protein n=1 Tax=Metapseudomonas otitidis TaxID=319939 RepID=UPI001F206F4C|nr:hypothetical protein [Pseudomonas otitidis]
MAISSSGSSVELPSLDVVSVESSLVVVAAASDGKALPLSATVVGLSAGAAAGLSAGSSLLRLSAGLSRACLGAGSLRSAGLACRSFAYIWAKLGAPLLLGSGVRTWDFAA